MIQVPNHGAYNVKNETLLNKFKTEYAVIFASAKNPADTRTLATLENTVEKTVFITANGSVEMKSDGNAIDIKQ